MPYLPNLIKRIDEFYRLAQMKYTMPDDPEEEAPDTERPGMDGLYGKMIQASKEIADPNLAEEVELIAEFYKKALELNNGNGFNLVNRGVSSALNFLDDSNSEEEFAVQDLLNEVSQDLRQRIKQAPYANPQADSKAEEALREVKNSFDRRTVQQDLTSEEPGHEDPDDRVPEGLEQYDEKATGKFDPTGGVGGEKGDRVNRGYSRGGGHSYVDWVKRYQNERDRFMHELSDLGKDPRYAGKSDRTKISIKSNLESLINTLDNAISLTQEALKLEASGDNPGRLQQVSDELKKTQAEKTRHASNLRHFFMADNLQDLEAKEQLAKDPKEKLYWNEQAKVQKLRLSGDKNTAEEIKWRNVLVKSMATTDTHGDLTFLGLSKDTLEKIKAGIRAGEAQKIPYAEVNRLKGVEIAKLKGIEDKDMGDRRRGSHNDSTWRMKNWNLDIIEFRGLVEHMTQMLATSRVVAKQAVSHEIVDGKKKHNALKPFVDAVAMAATKRDKSALSQASLALASKMEEFKNRSQAIKAYQWNIRYSKLFYDLRDGFLNVSKFIEAPELTAEQKSIVEGLIRTGELLIKHYKTNYAKLSKTRINERGWGNINYDKSVLVLGKLLDQLKNKIGVAQ